MKLRLRYPSDSKKLNSFQQACRISLKQNALRMGDFLEIVSTALGSVDRPLGEARPGSESPL
jgi:hypothetical protein